jgi:hypothetical protein
VVVTMQSLLPVRGLKVLGGRLTDRLFRTIEKFRSNSTFK